MKPAFLDGVQKKYINYNEIVNKIVGENKKEKIEQINLPINPLNLYEYGSKINIEPNAPQENINLQPINSFNERDLNLFGSKQNSFMGLSLDGDYSRMQSTIFNNK